MRKILISAVIVLMLVSSVPVNGATTGRWDLSAAQNSVNTTVQQMAASQTGIRERIDFQWDFDCFSELLKRLGR